MALLRFRKHHHRRNEMQTDAQTEVVNVEECPEAGTEVCTLAITQRTIGVFILVMLLFS